MARSEKIRAGQWYERFPNKTFSESEISYLNSRYGNSSFSWRLPGLILALIGIPWLTWSAVYHANPEIRYSLQSFQILENEPKPTIEIQYLVQRRDKSVEVACTLVARDIDKNVVGEIHDVIPPSEMKSIVRNVKIPARLSPVSAAVIDCR